MHSQEFISVEKEPLRFPKIGPKSKSLPSNQKPSTATLDLVTAKSWLYCVGDYQFGKDPPIQASRRRPSGKSPRLPR